MSTYIDYIKTLDFKKIVLWGVVVLLSLSFIVLMFDKIIMPWYVRSDATETVPDVVGMKLDEADKYLKDNGFTPHKADERFDQRYPKGTVVLQNPPPAAIVKPGRRVYLTISSGEQLVEVPSVRGHSVRNARFILERAGLNMGSISYETSSLYHENTIMEQGIASGKEVARGTAINVVVSQGSITDKVMVPELVGKTLSEAQRLLNQRGLRVGNITYQPIPDLLPNTIVQQYPHPGDRIPRSQPVDIFIAQEPPRDARDLREGGGGIE
jgi:eukaryotic-like serine/threonine-protein kinase